MLPSNVIQFVASSELRLSPPISIDTSSNIKSPKQRAIDDGSPIALLGLLKSIQLKPLHILFMVTVASAFAASLWETSKPTGLPEDLNPTGQRNTYSEYQLRLMEDHLASRPETSISSPKESATPKKEAQPEPNTNTTETTNLTPDAPETTGAQETAQRIDFGRGRIPKPVPGSNNFDPLPATDSGQGYLYRYERESESAIFPTDQEPQSPKLSEPSDEWPVQIGAPRVREDFRLKTAPGSTNKEHSVLPTTVTGATGSTNTFETYYLSDLALCPKDVDEIKLRGDLINQLNGRDRCASANFNFQFWDRRYSGTLKVAITSSREAILNKCIALELAIECLTTEQ